MNLAAIIPAPFMLLLERRNQANYVYYDRNCVLSTFPQAKSDHQRLSSASWV